MFIRTQNQATNSGSAQSTLWRRRSLAVKGSGSLSYATGGVINAYVAHIIGSPYDMFFRPAHTSINTVVAGGGRRVLRLLNDTHHLRTGEADFLSY